MIISTVILLAMAVFAGIVAASTVKLGKHLLSGKSKNTPEQSIPKAENIQTQEKAPVETIKKSLKSELSARRITDTYIHDEGNGVDLTNDGAAKLLSQMSSMTEIESRNRRLAGKEFRGFNLNIQESKGVSLTYAGQVLAIMDRIYDDEGQIMYHVNTFPPVAMAHLLPTEIRKMLDAINEIGPITDSSGLVFSKMCDIVCEPSNIDALRQDLSPKLQAMVSKSIYQSEEKAKKLEPDSSKGMKI